MGIRQNIDPGQRCVLSRLEDHEVFLSVRGKSPEAVSEHQIGIRKYSFIPVCRTGIFDGPQTRHGNILCFTTAELFFQRPHIVFDDDAGNRLKKNAVFAGYLIARSHKNAAWPVGSPVFHAGGNQSHDLIMKRLPIDGIILIPDDEIHGQTL